MRQVIRRFLKHLEAEKNASVTTIESYQYDLHKFDAYLVKRLGNKFLPGDVSRDHIRDYLVWLAEVGHQKPNGPSARARALAAIRSFFKYAHRAGLLKAIPAADIALPKIRMGEIRRIVKIIVEIEGVQTPVDKEKFSPVPSDRSWVCYINPRGEITNENIRCILYPQKSGTTSVAEDLTPVPIQI